MKVLIYGAETFFGKSLITRFKKDGHPVVGIYTEKMENKAEGVSFSYYVSSEAIRAADILRYEKPDMILYARIEPVSHEAMADARIRDISVLARLSDAYDVKKFLYVSSLDVYGGGEPDENAPGSPDSLSGKANAACEKILLSYRANRAQSTVIFRTGEIWGEEDGESTPVRLLREAKSRSGIRENLSGWIFPLYIGDLVDACVRAVSDNVNGIYNLCASRPIRVSEVANGILSHLGRRLRLHPPEPAAAPAAPSCNKAEHEIGFVRMYQPEQAVEMIAKRYSERAPEEIKAKKKRKRSPLQNYFESAVLFLLIAFTKDTIDLNINIFIIYCILAASFGGMSHGILAALLCGVWEVAAVVSSGFDYSAAAYNFGALMLIVEYIATALCIGYVIDHKDRAIDRLKERIAAAESENVSVRQFNRELGEIKLEYESRLEKYEGGILQLYTAFSAFNTTSMSEILLKAPRMIHDLTGEENISIYIVQKQSGYLRRLSYIGKASGCIPTAFRYADVGHYQEIIDQGTFYSNQYLDENMPSIAAPISADGEVIALMVIEDYSIEKYNRYYLNMLGLASGIISDFCSRAKDHREIINSLIYEEGTPILKDVFFRSSWETAQKASLETSFSYCMLELIPKEGEEIAEIAARARSTIRDQDEIGRLEDGRVAVLLYAINREDAKIVSDRLMNVNIRSKLL